MAKGTCSIEGCERPAKTRGWCQKHYVRWLAHGDPMIVLPPGKPRRRCTVCGEPARSHGFCGVHLGKWRRHGDPLWTRPSGRTDRMCERCGVVFSVKRCVVAKGQGRFCSVVCRNAALKGREVTWGKAISDALVGRPLSPQHRAKISAQRRGVPTGRRKANPVTPEHERIRKSIAYRAWRTAVFERDDYTCQFCGKRGGRLNADHIKPFAEFPALRFEISNGRTLCEPCHRRTPTFGRRTPCDSG